MMARELLQLIWTRLVHRSITNLGRLTLYHVHTAGTRDGQQRFKILQQRRESEMRLGVPLLRLLLAISGIL